MSWLDLHLPVMPVLIPLLVAPLVALMRDRALGWSAALATSFCTLAVAVHCVQTVGSGSELRYLLGSWAAPYGIELRVDAFSALLLLIVTGASSAGLLLARSSLSAEVERRRQHLYYAAWLLALGGLSGIIVSGDAFNIFVFMEISSLATYVLIAGGTDRRALTAVFRYLIMGTIGATFYLVGVGLIYMMTGTLNLADISARLDDVSSLRPVLAAGGFIVAGLALKAAIFPLHGWLPNAYRFAPHVATVFIAACSTKVALYVLLRFDFLVLRGRVAGYAETFTVFAVALGIIAMLAGSILALRQRELKRLLAYSSVAQTGYILVGVGLASMAGLMGALVHFFNHALAKGALFGAVACLATRVSSLAIRDLTGIAKSMPWTMAAFVLAGLSLIGIPGTAGFIGKWLLLQGALDLGIYGLLLALPMLLSSLLAVGYMLRVIESAYSKPLVSSGRHREAPRTMLAVVWLLALSNLYFGMDTSFSLNLARQSATALLDIAPALTLAGSVD